MPKRAFRFFTMFTVFLVQNSCFAQFSSISAIQPNSPPNFGPNSFFSSFPNAFSSLSPASGNFEQPNSNLPPGNSFSPSASSPSASAGFSSQPPQQSTNPSPLETFISTYTKAVHSSAALSDLYDLTKIPIQSLEDFFYNAIYSLSISKGISDHNEISSYANLPFVDNFEVLTSPVFFGIVANAMGKYLLAEGILNDMNAASLASAFADDHEASVKRTVDKNFQESKLQAMVDAYVGFLKAEGLLTREKLPAAAKYFRDEVELTGKRFGRKSMS